MKYDWKFKLECVEEYMKGRWKRKPDYVSCSDEEFHNRIREWVRIHRIYGPDGLKHKTTNKKWTAEERYELVAQVLAGRSIKSTAIEADISVGQLYQWVRRYKLYGYDGLQLRKGRRSKEPAMKEKPEELTQSEKEELILLRRQLEYLRAENAYLKKLRALIAQKKAESSVKAKKHGSSPDSEEKDTD